jgi:hypothetical protein
LSTNSDKELASNSIVQHTYSKAKVFRDILKQESYQVKDESWQALGAFFLNFSRKTLHQALMLSWLTVLKPSPTLLREFCMIL